MVRRRAYSASRTAQNIVRNSSNIFSSSLQWYEMMTASAMTIALRLDGINDNLTQNRQPDMAELLRMVSEKNSAWLQGGTALMRWQESLLKQPPNAWLVPSSSAGFATLSQLLAYSAHWTALSLKGFSQVMKPYHASSTANARRLSRKSRSK